MELATLTAKGQVTVPKAVRDALGLKRGDVLSWELDDQSVRAGLSLLSNWTFCGELKPASLSGPVKPMSPPLLVCDVLAAL